MKSRHLHAAACLALAGNVWLTLTLILCVVSSAFGNAALAATHTDESRPGFDAVGTTLRDTLYRPAHAALDEASTALLTSAEASCDANDSLELHGKARHGESAHAQSLEHSAGGTDRLDPIRTAYAATANAFSTIELLRVGPLLDNNRQNRLFYWPDPRRAGERQLRSLLTADPATLTADSMSERSVAVQGLPALERLLYGRLSDELASASSDSDTVQRHCAAIVAISGNVAALSAELAAEWQADDGIARKLASPQAADTLFRSTDEVVRSVLTQLAGGLDVMIDVKLAPMLDSEPPRRGSSPFRSSALTPVNLLGNLSSMRTLAIESGLAESAGLEAELDFEFRIARNHLTEWSRSLPSGSWPNVLADDEASLLRALHSTLSSIRRTINERLAPSLGIRTGFNAEDGD